MMSVYQIITCYKLIIDNNDPRKLPVPI